MDEALKPCPFCGGEADYHSEKGPTGEVYGWVGCNQCDAMSCHTDTRSMQPEETHPIDAWNTRADAAPTPNAEVVEAVARAVAPMMEGGREFDQMPPTRLELRQWSRSGMCSTNDATQDDATELAQAAIAALDAARGDPVARLIAHMKTIEPDEETAGCPATWADFIQILEGIAEAGEPFNG